MAYRVEIASSNRAGCNATHCKKESVKIPKGEIRQGVWVEYEDRGSYKWRHWGCVTPEVLHNWNQASEGNMDLIDGFDELPEGAQAKVQRCLEQGHVDDEDWNGDIECNRWTGQKSMGMFVKGQARKKKDAEEADEDDGDRPAPAKKPAAKKRKAAETNNDDSAVDVQPAAKKTKAKKTQEAIDDGGEAVEAEKPVPKTSRARKAKAVDKDSSPVKAPAAKKGRGKKAALVAESEDELATDPMPAPAPKKKGRKAAAKDNDNDAGEETVKPKPKRRKTASKKAAASEED